MNDRKNRRMLNTAARGTMTGRICSSSGAYPLSTTGSMTSGCRNGTIAAAQKKEGMTVKTMVPKDKMSRKARRSLDLERRTVWAVNPVPRVRESGKLYSRKRAKRPWPDD